MLLSWPDRGQQLSLDLRAVRGAAAHGDADLFLEAVAGRDVDDALQQIGAVVPMALSQRRDEAEPVALSLIDRLTWRDDPGDLVLAEDLLACLRREHIDARLLPVDLDELSSELEGDMTMSSGGYLDLLTGQVHDETATDAMVVGDDVVIDVEQEPTRWLRFERRGSREAWRDMADFAVRQTDAALRHRMEQAISGAGAFRRFRDVIHAEGLVEPWEVFSTDRRWGRSRAYLAAEGIRVQHHTVSPSP
ncbi:hypothetical protein [Aeromicrobium phragmitis]|uniref:hypothetical protein n=1 Tax=Aeromicrobium phragmitis TaxID=2478914 RepID=UPI001AA07FA3|nr:hypothetical protein [Aeromicrobium phragmitis]